MDALPDDPVLLIRLLDKFDDYNAALLGLDECLGTEFKLEVDLRQECSTLPPAEQVARLRPWGLLASDFGNRVRDLEDQIRRCREPLRPHLGPSSKPSTNPLADAAHEVNRRSSPEQYLALRGKVAEMMEVKQQCISEDLQQGQSLRAEVEKRLSPPSSCVQLSLSQLLSTERLTHQPPKDTV